MLHHVLLACSKQFCTCIQYWVAVVIRVRVVLRWKQRPLQWGVAWLLPIRSACFVNCSFVMSVLCLCCVCVVSALQSVCRIGGRVALRGHSSGKCSSIALPAWLLPSPEVPVS